MVVKNSIGRIRVVLYLRRSSDKQAESIPSQRSAILAHCKRMDYVVVREYVDDAISGDDIVNRHAFRRMAYDAKNLRDFTLIVCWDQERWGRFDSIEAGGWVAIFRDAGVALETLDHGRCDWTTFQGRLIWNINQDMKHEHNVKLSLNVARGAMTAISNGRRPGGKAPYGYRIDRSSGSPVLVPRDDEAPVLRELFVRYASGKESLSDLIDDLNMRGVPTRGGGPWLVPTLRQMLKNPVYLGRSVFNRTNQSKYFVIKEGRSQETPPKTKIKKNGDDLKKTKLINNPPEEWLYSNEEHEALVDRKTFDKVAEKLFSRRNKGNCCPRKGGGEFLLSGKMRCGACGHSMHGKALHEKQDGSKTVIYGCSGAANGGKTVCQHWSTQQGPILAFVADEIFHRLLDPERRAAWQAKLREELTLAATVPAVNVEGLKVRIKDLNRKIEAGRDRIFHLPPSQVYAFGQRIEELENEKAEAERVLAEHAQAAATSRSIDERIQESLDGLCTMGTWRPGQSALDRQAVQDFVDVIICHPKDEKGYRGKDRLLCATVFLRGEAFLPRTYFHELYGAEEASGSYLSSPPQIEVRQKLLTLTFTPQPAA